MHDTCLQYRNSPSRRVSHILCLVSNIYHAISHTHRCHITIVVVHTRAV